MCHSIMIVLVFKNTVIMIMSREDMYDRIRGERRSVNLESRFGFLRVVHNYNCGFKVNQTFKHSDYL